MHIYTVQDRSTVFVEFHTQISSISATALYGFSFLHDLYFLSSAVASSTITSQPRWLNVHRPCKYPSFPLQRKSEFQQRSSSHPISFLSLSLENFIYIEINGRLFSYELLPYTCKTSPRHSKAYRFLFSAETTTRPKPKSPTNYTFTKDVLPHSTRSQPSNYSVKSCTGCP